MTDLGVPLRSRHPFQSAHIFAGFTLLPLTHLSSFPIIITRFNH